MATPGACIRLNPFEIRAELPREFVRKHDVSVAVSIPLKSGLNCRSDFALTWDIFAGLNPFEIRAELPRQLHLQFERDDAVSIPLKSGLNCRVRFTAKPPPMGKSQSL